MDLQIDIGGRTRRVRTIARGNRLVVTVDGREHVVDARAVEGGAWSLLLTDPDGAARSVEATLSPLSERGAYDVHVAGHRVPVQVRNGSGAGARDHTPSGGAATGPLRVTAPMPGKIVRVLVRPGDDVKARQSLVVIEAMKMENELRAARDGRVRTVPAAEGSSVDAGAVLVEIDPKA